MNDLIAQVGIGGIFVLLLVRVIVDAVEKLKGKDKNGSAPPPAGLTEALKALTMEMRAMLEILKEMQRVQQRCMTWHFDTSGLPRWLEFQKISNILHAIESHCRHCRGKEKVSGDPDADEEKQ